MINYQVYALKIDQIAMKECSGGAKKQIDQGFSAMSGMHSILNVKPTYIGVDGTIYQDRDHKKNGDVCFLKSHVYKYKSNACIVVFITYSTYDKYFSCPY